MAPASLPEFLLYEYSLKNSVYKLRCNKICFKLICNAVSKIIPHKVLARQF